MHFIFLISLLPVAAFVVFLVFADSFKLISAKTLLICVAWGILAAYLAERLNLAISGHLNLTFSDYARYVAPLVEEPLKLMMLLLLIRYGRIGFLIDAAIYGFTVGAVFAVYENITYYNDPGTDNPMVLIIRGFGTSLMHGGCTTLGAMLLIRTQDTIRIRMLPLIQALLIALFIHSLYNHFIISPVGSTILIVLILPPALMIVFNRHERRIRQWMEMELFSEVQLLKMIREGNIGQSRPGQFIAKLKGSFSAETIVDMLCYIELYTALSVKAKSRLLLAEAGLPYQKDPETGSSLVELKALGKRIGRTGLMALSPVLRLNQRDIWKLTLLEN
ncbi:MAG TPA: PrsW family glutamic-type intramembrane protease [Bacteroidales bacterium]|nr:PrsW family glutamic-type intramembrane protease [Bacteroidales bacterium]HSA44722.1 PrsW family glutamic-type intramembrane protease [Bacteroidales bacterium]